MKSKKSIIVLKIEYFVFKIRAFVHLAARQNNLPDGR